MSCKFVLVKNHGCPFYCLIFTMIITTVVKACRGVVAEARKNQISTNSIVSHFYKKAQIIKNGCHSIYKKAINNVKKFNLGAGAVN